MSANEPLALSSLKELVRRSARSCAPSARSVSSATTLRRLANGDSKPMMAAMGPSPRTSVRVLGADRASPCRAFWPVSKGSVTRRFMPSKTIAALCSSWGLEKPSGRAPITRMSLAAAVAASTALLTSTLIDGYPVFEPNRAMALSKSRMSVGEMLFSVRTRVSARSANFVKGKPMREYRPTLGICA